MVKKGIGDICAASYVAAVKRYIKATGIKKPDEEDAIKYIMTFHEKRKSYSHIVNTSLALERYSEYNGTSYRLGRPRKPRRVIKDTLKEHEIARMFVFTTNIREKALLAVLCYTGLRNLETCLLTVGDINFQENSIFVKGGKGKKDGVVCVSPACITVIKEYLLQYPRTRTQTLFFTVAQNKAQDRLLQQAVRKHIKRIAQRAGIEKRVYPHLMRHSLAMNMLHHGSDLYTVKEQLRHAHITTTLTYVFSDVNIMQNRYQIFAPNYMWETGLGTFMMNTRSMQTPHYMQGVQGSSWYRSE
jgi:site-specific recombinase XerD